jgi:hypothetical protein
MVKYSSVRDAHVFHRLISVARLSQSETQKSNERSAARCSVIWLLEICANYIRKPQDVNRVMYIVHIEKHPARCLPSCPRLSNYKIKLSPLKTSPDWSNV